MTNSKPDCIILSQKKNRGSSLQAKFTEYGIVT